MAPRLDDELGGLAVDAEHHARRDRVLHRSQPHVGVPHALEREVTDPAYEKPEEQGRVGAVGPHLAHRADEDRFGRGGAGVHALMFGFDNYLQRACFVKESVKRCPRGSP